MPNDLTEIGLCPRCGAEAALAVGFPKHKVGREIVTETINWVHCKGCGATGGTGRNALEAIKKWNRRITKNEQRGVFQDDRPPAEGG